MENLVHIQIRGVYDGVCVVFDKKSNCFEWIKIAIERTTRDYRKKYERNFLKQIKSNGKTIKHTPNN